MSANILFASSSYTRYDPDVTLPAKFKRMVPKMGLKDKVCGKSVAIKMHVGRNIGFTTIHPLFVKILIDELKTYGVTKVFVTDQVVEDATARGYREEFLGCPVVDVCGVLGKYYYEHEVDFKTFKNVDIAGHINDVDFMINLSHIKGHGCCAFGGSCKNIAMGCVTDRTRQQIHGLEGGLVWHEELCTHCDQCIKSCGHNANSFVDGKYTVDFHNCTFCQHCTKVCPTHAVEMDASRFDDFQTGMALATKTVLDTFDKGNVYYISFLTNITAVCDCWGLSTPNIVPDIGIFSGDDMVAMEHACIDAIKIENFLPNGAPKGFELQGENHLFHQLHGRDPFVQLDKLVEAGLGKMEYTITETF